ncbi:SHOCT domain-containing protein [Haloparvum sp. PAK95]|uniref:SHOCT domain-containing protein n=1 Tax=Haloparvum sp. PAK95 TaxID=3418962 RepID=UPI003D2F4D88
MANDSPVERARENLTGIVSVVVTATWLGALLAGQDWWLAFMLVGYVAVVPIVALLFGDEEDRAEWWSEGESSDSERTATAESDRRDALQTIRDRYARGELTEEQFERKLETLLETETLEDVKGRDSIATGDGESRPPARDGTDAGRSTQPETELERDP